MAVFVTRSRRVTFQPERVAYWTWTERTVRSLGELRDLRSEPQLARTVLRLTIELTLSAPELDEAEAILRELKGTTATRGRAGILQVDRGRMRLDTAGIEALLADLPDVLRTTVAHLRTLEASDQGEVARSALYHLYRLVREAGAP